MLMNRRKLLLLFAPFLFVMAGVAPAQNRKQEEGARVKPEQQISVENYLAELGAKADCYFTIEEASHPGDTMAPISSFALVRLRRPGGLQSELEALEAKVPHFSFVVDKERPRIIHVIDRRLREQSGYGLEVTLKEIDFEGTVEDLLAEINKQGVPVSSPTSISTEDMLSWDLSTTVQVKGRNLKVRDALSLFLPLDTYGRVLWVARTNAGQGLPTHVLFRGPRR